MDILIIGNGFDLAHGLKTNYTDFLSELKQEKSDIFLEENRKLIDNNLFVKYFKGVSEAQTWIDFELEIKGLIDCIANIPFEAVKHIEKNNLVYEVSYLNKSDYGVFMPYQSDLNDWGLKRQIESNNMYFDIFSNLFSDGSKLAQIKEKDYLEKIDQLKFEYNQFIDLFVIYIQHINKESVKPKEYFKGDYFDRVVSFNYTNTYEKLYCNKNLSTTNSISGTTSFVHGKVSENDHNIVLGIGSDYYEYERYHNFIDFFKSFQRLFRKTDNDFMSYEEKLLRNYKGNTVYIYGHSLDYTDKDVIYPFLNSEFVDKVVIFYYVDKERNEMSKIVSNLEKMLEGNLFKKYCFGTKEKKIDLVSTQELEQGKYIMPKKKKEVHRPPTASAD